MTGNTDGATYWQDGNGVFKYQPGPIFTNESVDYFTPTQWKAYDDADVDLCGSEPVVLDLPGGWPSVHIAVSALNHRLRFLSIQQRLAGSTPSQLLLQCGKDGNVWVLDRQNLGGVGGQLFVKQASKSVSA